MANISGDVK